MSESSQSYFKESISLLTRTLPFVGVNVVVYGVFFVLSLIWFGIWGGLAYLMARLGLGVVAVVFVIIGFGAGAALVKFARRYLLYMVKGAHIAAVTELLKDGELPGGMGQFQYGRQIIEERFQEVSILFGIDVLVNASLKALQRKLLRVTRWIPLPGGAKKAVGVVTEILNRALTYVDEAILSYAISLGEDNVWNSARHGVILYAQSFKPILITAAKVWVMGKVIGFLAFLFFLAPAVVVMLAIDAIIVQVVAVVLALVASWALKAALFEPFAMTYTLVTYHRTIAGQTPDPDWDERLQGVSSKYRELVGKAEEAKQSAQQPAQKSIPA
jgi:hypothetical protein